MKKIINISLLIIFVIAIASLSVYIYMQYQNGKVKSVEVNIIRENPKRGYLNQQTVLQLINKDSVLMHQKVKKVNIPNLIKRLLTNPFINAADVYFNLTGSLIVNIREKKAVLKVYTLGGQGFYIGSKGSLFPVETGYSPHVLIANGYINSMPWIQHPKVTDLVYSKTKLPDLYHLAIKLDSNNFMQSAISQIYINSKHKIDLIPEIGNQLIRFGTIEDANIKLENLEAFYRQVFVNEDGNKYKEINLQYVNQIVCTKN